MPGACPPRIDSEKSGNVVTPFIPSLADIADFGETPRMKDRQVASSHICSTDGACLSQPEATESLREPHRRFFLDRENRYRTSSVRHCDSCMNDCRFAQKKLFPEFLKIRRRSLLQQRVRQGKGKSRRYSHAHMTRLSPDPACSDGLPRPCPDLPCMSDVREQRKTRMSFIS